MQFVRSWYRLSKRLLCNGLHWHSPPFLLACTSYVTPTHTNAQPVLSLLSTNQVRVAATGMNAPWGRGVSRGSRRNKILESTEWRTGEQPARWGDGMKPTKSRMPNPPFAVGFLAPLSLTFLRIANFCRATTVRCPACRLPQCSRQTNNWLISHSDPKIEQCSYSAWLHLLMIPVVRDYSAKFRFG